MPQEINQFSNAKELDEELCKFIRDKINFSIKKKGFSSIAISGGKTPLNLYKLLSKERIDWRKVFISIVDERCVHGDEGSNIKNIKHNFNFSLKNHPEIFEHSYKFEGDKVYLLNKNVRAPLPFDFVLLGMGEDGHIASIFPNQKETNYLLSSDCDQEILLVETDDSFKHRITFTLPTITNTKLIIIIIKGISKIEALQEAITSDTDNITSMPIRALFLDKKVPIRVFQSFEK